MIDFSTLTIVPFGWPQVFFILYFILIGFFNNKEVNELFNKKKDIGIRFYLYINNNGYWRGIFNNIHIW
ncbi:hypothetical protein A0O00_00320 [Proteus mirabilis]|nr:hypothetical protein A0O00_00320 [Proteus mirabilis]